MKNNNIFTRIDFIVGMLCLFLFFSLLTIFTNADIADFDVWLHLKTGELILANKAVPHQDIYSYTYFGNKWIDHEWLFQVIAYSAYSKLGPSGLLIMQTIIILLAFLIFILIGYHSREYLIYIVPLLFCLLIYRQRFSIRPEMFSILFFSIYFLIIDRYLENKWWPFVLIPIQIIWANMHGFFFLGPLLILFLIISDFIKSRMKLPWQWNNTNRLSNHTRKKLKWVLLFLILVCFINPYFWEGAIYPLRVLFSLFGKSDLFFKHIIELKPPVTSRNIFHLLQSGYLGYYAILIVLSLISFKLNLKKIDIFNINIWVVFFILSSISVRNSGYFSFITYFVFLKNITALSQAGGKAQLFFNEKIKYLIKWIIVILIIFFIVGHGWRFLNREYYLFDENVMNPAFLGFSKMAYPEKAVDFILETNIKGNIYNEFNSGSYLIGRTYPQLRVFIDGRTEVYGQKMFKKFVRICEGDISLLDEQLKEYDVNVVLLNSVFFEIPKSILNHLYRAPEWKLVYFDEFAVIFLKDTEQNKDVIEKFELDLDKWQVAKADLEKIGSQKVAPYTYINRAYTLYGLGFYEQAILEGKEAIRIKPDSLEAHKLLGAVYHRQKLNTQAFEHFRIGSIFYPRDAEMRTNLGILFAELGNFNNARKEMEKAIKINPYYSDAYYNLALLFSKTGENKKTIRLLKKAIKLKPSSIIYLVELGNAYLEDKDLKSAYDTYMNALERNPNSVEIHTDLGRVLYEMGRLNEAEEKYKLAIEIDKNYVDAYNSLGVVYASMNRTDEAKSLWKQGLKLDPDNSEIKENLKRLKTVKSRKKK